MRRHSQLAEAGITQVEDLLCAHAVSYAPIGLSMPPVLRYSLYTGYEGTLTVRGGGLRSSAARPGGDGVFRLRHHRQQAAHAVQQHRLVRQHRQPARPGCCQSRVPAPPVGGRPAQTTSHSHTQQASSYWRHRKARVCGMFMLRGSCRDADHRMNLSSTGIRTDCATEMGREDK